MSETKLKFYAIVLSVLLFNSGCVQKVTNDTAGNSNSVTNVTLHSMENTLADSLYFNESEVIFLETNKSSFHKRIDKVFIDDGKIFVFDKSLSKIVVYDLEGKHLSHLHAIGRGPEEYTSLNDIFVDTETKRIHLLCDYPFKIMSFDYDLEFINETKNDKLYLEFVAQDGYFICRQAETENNVVNDFYLDIIKQNNQGEVISQLPIRASIEDLTARRTPGSMLTKSASVLFSSFDDHALYEIRNQEAQKKYNFNLNIDSSDRAIQGQIVNIADMGASLFFKTKTVFYRYEKASNVLKGYKYGVRNTGELNSSLTHFLPIGNSSDKIAFVYFPALLKFAEKALREKLSSSGESSQNGTIDF